MRYFLANVFNRYIPSQKTLNYIINSKYDHAFHVLETNTLINNVKKWFKYFSSVVPFYAVKSNSNQHIIKTLNKMKINFDCASPYECELIKMTSLGSLTFSKDNNNNNIIFANPQRSPKTLKYLKDNNIKWNVIDHNSQIELFKKYNIPSNIFIRINVNNNYSICNLGVKFGCCEKELYEILNKQMNYLKNNFLGFSFHVGSGCSNHKAYDEAFENVKKAMNMFKRKGIDTNIIDIGGGFPSIEHYDGQLQETANIINKFQSEYPNIKLIAEPGRFFSGNVQTLVINIIGKKFRNNEFIYYIDDGLYHSFNCELYDHIEAIKDHKLTLLNTNSININKKYNENKYKSRIYGQTCDGFDELAKTIDLHLPELEIGDKLIFPCMGAYTSEGSSNFNGFKATPVYLI